MHLLSGPCNPQGYNVWIDFRPLPALPVAGVLRPSPVSFGRVAVSAGILPVRFPAAEGPGPLPECRHPRKIKSGQPVRRTPLQT